MEFPEARIYEETLNILLYENRNVPDMELMQATSSRGAVSSMTSYGSDDEDDVHRKASTGSRDQSREVLHNHGLNRLRGNKS